MYRYDRVGLTRRLLWPSHDKSQVKSVRRTERPRDRRQIRTHYSQSTIPLFQAVIIRTIPATVSSTKIPASIVSSQSMRGDYCLGSTVPPCATATKVRSIDRRS